MRRVRCIFPCMKKLTRSSLSKMLLCLSLTAIFTLHSNSWGADGKAFPSVVSPSTNAGNDNESSTEDFKGSPSEKEVTAGVTMGYGRADALGGFAVHLNAAKKILNRGFVNDINNQVFLEFELGPVFRDGADPFLYSVHGRWDFQKDSQWTFFAIGGLAGHYYHVADKSHVGFYPRFGIGSFYHIVDNVSIRAEVSHELIAVGASARF